MPTETRTLTFSRGELADALREFGPRAGVTLPPGTIMYLSLSAGPEIEVTVKLVPDGSAGIESRVVGPVEIGACLIHYCIARRIPIPRQAARSLQVVGEAVAMQFAINETAVRLPALA